MDADFNSIVQQPLSCRPSIHRAERSPSIKEGFRTALYFKGNRHPSVQLRGWQQRMEFIVKSFLGAHNSFILSNLPSEEAIKAILVL